MHQLKDRYRNLTEVRWTLEVEIASLAAERAEPNDIADLEAALSGIKTNAHDVDQFISYDLAFHSALAAAAHNEVYRVFMMLIVELLSEFRLKACHQDFCGTLMDTSTHYALIVRHIKNHDPVETRTAVREYLHYNQGLEESVLAS
jgi:GntR family transcriptional repressor for pyruvate dehydrogenase complex